MSDDGVPPWRRKWRRANPIFVGVVALTSFLSGFGTGRTANDGSPPDPPSPGLVQSQAQGVREETLALDRALESGNFEGVLHSLQSIERGLSPYESYDCPPEIRDAIERLQTDLDRLTDLRDPARRFSTNQARQIEQLMQRITFLIALC